MDFAAWPLLAPLSSERESLLASLWWLGESVRAFADVEAVREGAGTAPSVAVPLAAVVTRAALADAAGRIEPAEASGVASSSGGFGGTTAAGGVAGPDDLAGANSAAGLAGAGASGGACGTGSAGGAGGAGDADNVSGSGEDANDADRVGKAGICGNAGAAGDNGACWNGGKTGGVDEACWDACSGRRTTVLELAGADRRVNGQFKGVLVDSTAEGGTEGFRLIKSMFAAAADSTADCVELGLSCVAEDWPAVSLARTASAAPWPEEGAVSLDGTAAKGEAREILCWI